MATPPSQPRPSGKVRQLGPTRFQPLLVLNQVQAPLGDAHASVESAEAAYDVSKLLLVRHLQPGRPFEELKLHRPAAAYTRHPLWAQLTAPHCSFKEACSLLAGGLAADFLLPPETVLLRTRQPRKAARRDGGSAAQQGAASGSVFEEEGTASGVSDGEEQDQGSGRLAGQKRWRCSSMGGGRQGGFVAGRRAALGSKWGGLEADGAPPGSQGLTMRLSPSEAVGLCGHFQLPERYARALAGAGSADQLSSTMALTTPDGRTHSCTLYQSGEQRCWFMGRTRPVLTSLRPVAAGDLLRFTPTGLGSASVAVVRAAPTGAAQEGEGHWGGASLAAAAPAGAAAAAAPPPRGGRVPSHFATKWSGLGSDLDPTDSRRYSMALAASSLKQGIVPMPARYAAAAFGKAPVEGGEDLAVTATSADGSTHSLVLCVREGHPRLRRMTRLLTSLGATPGDVLCLEPAGRFAVRASLVKAAAAAVSAAAAAAAAAVPMDEGQEECSSDREEETHGAAASTSQAATPSLDVATGPAAPDGAAAGQSRSAWRGLEPGSRRYTKGGLPASTFKTGYLNMPAPYAAAAFGRAPEKGEGPLEVTATSAADGSVHTLAVTKYPDETRLRRLRPLLASLAAAPGDSLCLEPAGPLAVRASLVKAAAAAAAEEEEQRHPTLGSRSTPATAAGAGGSAAASLPNHAPPQHSMASLCSAADQLLAALEMQGGVAPSRTAAFRSTFAALPSHDWRQANIARLRRFVDSGDWEGAAAWMAQG